MKKITKFIASFLSVTLIAGSVGVFADDSVIDVKQDDIMLISAPEADEAVVEIDEEAVETAQVFVTLESANGLSYIGSDAFAADGSVTAADVIAALLVDHEVVGLEDGYISSIDGLAAATFGGWDGWMYAVKYYAADENGDVSLYIDVPVVGMNDYVIEASCNIVLYYADYGAPYAGTAVDENGMVKLVTYSAVYDENYNLVEFAEAPLANGEFVLTAYTVDENGEVVMGETYTFAADENGLTKLHQDLREVPNGTYYGSVGKQSEKSVELGEITVNLPEVVRYSDIFTVDAHPTQEELFKEKLFRLMLGMAR